jgi:2-hydroxycyclohexanecarboxyl-CoA dehydrogenase
MTLLEKMSRLYRSDAFADRIVLVTGAGAGVGGVIARSFALFGARVVVNDISEDAVAKTVDAMGLASDRVIPLVADVSSIEDAERGVRAIADTWSRSPDILVNNAAVISEVQLFTDLSPQSIERDLHIGLVGTMNMSRAVLGGMIDRGYGRIVNIASDAGRAGNARLSSYSATKGGVIAFTKALAQEVGEHGVTVNALSPGSVMAPMRDQILQNIGERLGADAIEERERARRNQYPTRRVAEPEDIANAAIFLSSDPAEDITGQTLSVNGGFRMY